MESAAVGGLLCHIAHNVRYMPIYGMNSAMSYGQDYGPKPGLRAMDMDRTVVLRHRLGETGINEIGPVSICWMAASSVGKMGKIYNLGQRSDQVISKLSQRIL